MSKLMAKLYKDKIVMCSDSRMAYEIDGIVYAVDDDCKKLFIIDDKNILWGSGKSWVLNKLVEKYKRSPIKNVNLLVELAQQSVEEHIQIGGVGSEYGYLQIVLAQIKNDKPSIHLTGDYYNWKIVSQEGEDEPIPAFGGSGCDIGNATYKKYDGKIPFKEIVKKSFNLASGNEVGGTLHIATMDKNGILEEAYPISDEGKKINRITQMQVAMLDSHSVAKNLYLGTQPGDELLDVYNALTTNDKGYTAIKGQMLDGKGMYVRDEDDDVSLQIDGKGNLLTKGIIYGSKIFSQANPPTQSQINNVPVGTIQGAVMLGGKMIAFSGTQPTLAQINAVPEGTIKGVTVEGSTITGSTFKTSESGARVQIDNTGLCSYDSDNQKEGWAINPHSGGVAGSLDYYVNNKQRGSFGRGGAGQNTFVFSYDDGDFDVRLSGGGAFKFNGKNIATEDDINALKQRIAQLESIVASLG